MMENITCHDSSCCCLNNPHCSCLPHERARRWCRAGSAGGACTTWWPSSTSPAEHTLLLSYSILWATAVSRLSQLFELDWASEPPPNAVVQVVFGDLISQFALWENWEERSSDFRSQGARSWDESAFLQQSRLVPADRQPHCSLVFKCKGSAVSVALLQCYTLCRLQCCAAQMSGRSLQHTAFHPIPLFRAWLSFSL